MRAILAVFLIPLAFIVGCTATGKAGSRLPALVEREVIGTWALTDERNNTYNVRLDPGGRMSSTWAYGPEGAKGLRGEWAIGDGEVRISFSDGWRDVLRRGSYGIEKVSWAPGTDLAGPPTAFGQALRLDEPIVEFIGVWQVTSALPGNAVFHVSLQSNRLAFKTIDEIRLGTCFYSIPERCVRIHWANGFTDRIRRDRDAYVLETWKPGSDRLGPPDRTSLAVRCE